MSHAQSLILVTVDCLRADHTGFLGYSRPTTPFLDTLASESLVFSNAIVAGAPTYHSFPAIMASRYPLALGRDLIGLAPGESTLASVLRESGYATAGFVATNPYISHRFGYGDGFETFKDFIDRDFPALPAMGNGNRWAQFNRRLANFSHKLGPLGTLYDELYFRYGQRVASRIPCSFEKLRRFPGADEIVDHACEWLVGTPGPFFLWLHFMDPHAPYYPLESALKAMGYGDLDAARARYLNSFWNRGDLGAKRAAQHRDEIVALYDAGIRSADDQIARLIGKLHSSGVWDNCVFAFTADHGEEFFEHGGRFHFPPKMTGELVHVPLLIHAPGVRPSAYSAPFSLLDLAPTLLSSIDAPAPASFLGKSQWSKLLRGATVEEPTITECTHHNPSVAGPLDTRILSIQEGKYKLIFDLRSRRETLWNLEQDPAELSPLPDTTEKPMRRRLLQKAGAHLCRTRRSMDLEKRLGLMVRNRLLEKRADVPLKP